MASSRFPGKPLVPLLGLPLVLHVYERCRLYEGFSEVVIATCDNEIMDAAKTHGAPVVMTAKDAVKCRGFADARCWALDVEARPSAGFIEWFATQLDALTRVAQGERQ